MVSASFYRKERRAEWQLRKLNKPYDKEGDGPEGPEVALFADRLNEELRGEMIVDVDLIGKYQDGHDAPNNFPDLNRSLPSIVEEVTYKGKLIIFVLENGYYLYSSLGMTGHWGKKISKHTHIVITTEKEEQYCFTDSRRFGRFLVEKDTILRDILAPSILGKYTLTKEKFVKRINDIITKDPKNRKWVEKVLIDQKILCSGIGNYLLSEIMYAAKIRKDSKLTDIEDWGKVYDVILELMEMSYKYGGASVNSYKMFDEKKGTFQDFMKVYGKKKDPDGNKVLKTKGKHGRTLWYVE